MNKRIIQKGKNKAQLTENTKKHTRGINLGAEVHLKLLAISFLE